jgi:hypothetical protein
LPTDYTNPLYPRGVLRQIPFSLTGCLNYEGTFECNPANEPCRTVLVYDDVNLFNDPFLQTTAIGMFTGGTPNEFGECPKTPCSTPVVLKLECTSLYFEEGDDSRCDKLWLWIGTKAIVQDGDLGETPGGFDYGPASWTRVRASSCVCDPVDGLTAVFAANVISDCSDAPLGTGGDCLDKPIGCCPINCSSTLSI